MEAEYGKRALIFNRTDHPKTARSRDAAWAGKNGSEVYHFLEITLL
jgi:hypothetical protein